MSQIRLLTLSGSINLLFVDPGVNVTGFAVVNVSKTGRNYLDYGKIKPDDKDVFASTIYVADSLRCIRRKFNVGYAWIEYPPGTLYGQNRLSKNLLIARASSVFKTVGVASAAIIALNDEAKVRPIFPVQWQPSKKQRGGMEIKAWSLQQANFILPKARLHTKEDENVADAIMLGHCVIEQLFQGELKL